MAAEHFSNWDPEDRQEKFSVVQDKNGHLSARGRIYSSTFESGLPCDLLLPINVIEVAFFLVLRLDLKSFCTFPLMLSDAQANLLEDEDHVKRKPQPPQSSQLRHRKRHQKQLREPFAEETRRIAKLSPAQIVNLQNKWFLF